MKLTRRREGYYWTTDDRAGLALNDAGPVPPESLRATVVETSGRSLPRTHNVPIVGLELVGVGDFGEARGSDHIKWTGSAYRFGVYRAPGRRAMVLETNGSGHHAYLFGFHSADTLLARAESEAPAALWDLCKLLTGTHRTATEAEAERWRRRIIEKRVKVNRRYKRPRLTVERREGASSA